MKTLLLLIVVLLFTFAASCAADDPPLHPSRVRDAIGINIHFTQPEAGEMPLLARTGLGWARMDFAWKKTETQAGVYDFRLFDSLLAQLKQAHMRPLWILDYGNPLYTGDLPPHDDAGRAAFARWAVAAVTHFQGQGIVWEIYNEPNNKEFWKPVPSAEDYAKLVLTVGAALRHAAPHETIIGPGDAAMDFAYLEHCFQAGVLQYWDAVSVHPYRQTTPESVGVDYQKLRTLIDKYAPPGKHISIVSSEWGYPIVWVSEAVQTDYLVREFLYNILSGVPISIWYDWHHGGQNPDRADIFGMVAPAHHVGQPPVFTPKPIYTSASVLTQTLGDFQFEKALPVGKAGQDFVLSFVRGREHRYAVWTTSATPQDVLLPAKAGSLYKVIDDVGTGTRTLVAGANGLAVRLTGSPQYLLPVGK